MGSSPKDNPLRELKYDGVPGGMKPFLIAIAVMALYLAIVLISSPGSVKKKHKADAGSGEAQPVASL